MNMWKRQIHRDKVDERLPRAWVGRAKMGSFCLMVTWNEEKVLTVGSGDGCTHCDCN